MNPARRPSLTPIQVWQRTPRDGSARLTEVRTVRDDPASVWLMLDGRRGGVVPRETAARLDLAARTPVPWTEDIASGLEAEVRACLCQRSALRMLAARMRCREGLVRSLTQRGHDRATAEACADAFVRCKAIDDDRYAEVVLRNELARKPAGRRLLEAKLRAKGISGDRAGKAVAAALRGRDEIDDARTIARSAVRGFRADADPLALRRRLAGRLTRRGFSSDTVRKVIDELFRGDLS